MTTRVYASVAIGAVAPDRWASRVAALRALGVDGLDVDVVWRRLATSEHRVDVTGPLALAPLARAAAAEGLPVRWHLGPRCDHGRPSLGLPEFVLSDEATWARGPHGGPVWLPVAPRAVPLLALDSERTRALVEIWIARIAAELAPHLGPADRVLGEWPGDGDHGLRDAPFALDYHPDAAQAFRVAAAAPPPRAWPDAPGGSDARAHALAWLAFTDARTARFAGFVDERLAIELGHRGVVDVVPAAAAARVPAHAVDPPWLLPITPARVPAREAEAFVRRAVERGAPEVRLRLADDADVPALAWLPTARAHAAAAAARVADPRTVAVVATVADRRIALASAPLVAMPAAALAWAAPGVEPGTLLGGDPRARRSLAWVAATAHGLASAGLHAETLPVDVADDELVRHAVIVVPTSAHVERDLWQRLCALAADRRVVVVVGDELPTDDELDRPLPPELRTPRRIGRMQAAALAEPALLGRDLAALLAAR